jgi:hypothetical protein
MPVRWDWPLAAPVRLRVAASEVPWNPDPQAPRLPILTTAQREFAERLTLVPYGCTKFRVSMFPVTGVPERRAGE